jgi:hypothetical protein
MDQLQSINQFYAEFEARLFDGRELEAKVFKYILDNPLHFGLGHFRHKDECADFLGWMYPRLSASIKKYVRGTATFDTYIIGTIRFAFKEYRAKQLHFYEYESNAWGEKSRELYVEEREMEYGPPVIIKEPEEKHEKFRNTRQMLILLLKTYYFLDDDIVSRAATRVGLQEDEIHDMIHKLREIRAKSEERIKMLCEHCNAQYFRYIKNEKRLRSLEEDSPYYKGVKDRVRMQRTRFLRIRQRLRRVRCNASNLQVARVLGLSKGTVDSAMAFVKSSALKVS